MSKTIATQRVIALFVVLGAFYALCPAAYSKTTIQAQRESPRILVPLSGSGWEFLAGSDSSPLPDINTNAFRSANWMPVSVPNDFQTRTSMTYDEGWYRRNVTISPALAHRHLYLVFAGAASVTDVYVNGKKLGEHRGAYTRFIFDATSYLHVGSDNVLTVLVDNRPESTFDCLPCVSGLYTVWGGLYRSVWLLATNDLQIDPTYFASPGIFITPTVTSPSTGDVHIEVLLRNTSAANQTTVVTATIVSPNGSITNVSRRRTDLDANGRRTITLDTIVTNPLLWSPEVPNLYHVRVDVTQGTTICDSLTQPLGFHTIVWDFENGHLTVNGKPYILYGVDLHQETEAKQSAVDAADLTQNIDTMKDLGVNFVRFAHYPRAQLEYDLCDQRGIFCWAENGHSHNDLATPTADQITTELVEQNYNHPSIIVWSVGNEGNPAPSEREVPVVKALDQTRPVVVANMSCDNADYRTTNTYPGWYGGGRSSFKAQGFISEIGAGGVIATHTDYADATHVVDSFEPEEYQQLVAETEFEDAFKQNNGRLGMFTWWVLRDFNDTKYKHQIAPFGHGINAKGLETYAGYKKDVYYLYRCFLRPNVTTIHITSKEYFLRQGKVTNGVKVYSNAQFVSLYLNGVLVSTERNGTYNQNNLIPTAPNQIINNVFYWPLPLRTGKNIVEASDGHGHVDTAVLYYYGASSSSELPITGSVIKDLESSNPANPAYFIDSPVTAQWPFYDNFDSTADNTLDSIPEPVVGSDWIALGRVTKSGKSTTVSFDAVKPVTVFVISTKLPMEPFGLYAAGLAPVKTTQFKWRGNDLILTDAELLSKRLTPGQHISISLGDRDALILLKDN